MTDRAEQLCRLLRRVQPLPRSLTGDGVRATLAAVADHLNSLGGPALNMREIPSGTPVLDWVVPDEWNLHDAWISDPGGRRLVDLAACGLHVVGYSDAVDEVMSYRDLAPHLHSLPDQPSLIPYRTSYHSPAWGFCVAQNVLTELENAGPLHVRIDSTRGPGSMTIGEIVIPGTGEDTVLLSTHTCHPWMVNDNVTGIVAATELALALNRTPRRHTVRILFLPGTLGSIAWLAEHDELIRTVRGGLVLTGLGDASSLAYKRSRRGNTLFDRTALDVLRERASDLRELDWEPYGYDERQFCSPGFDLPVGRLTRGVHGRYPEYHTSADDLGFVDAARVVDAIDAVLAVLERFDAIDAPVGVDGRGEPQLGRRGLYRSTGGAVDHRSVEMAYLWVLSLSDGEHTQEELARRSGLDTETIAEAVRRLRSAGLIR